MLLTSVLILDETYQQKIKNPQLSRRLPFLFKLKLKLSENLENKVSGNYITQIMETQKLNNKIFDKICKDLGICLKIEIFSGFKITLFLLVFLIKYFKNRLRYILDCLAIFIQMSNSFH